MRFYIENKFWLGGNIFGYSARESDVMEILDKAAYSKICGIDTSSSYSDGVSERMIGNWLNKNQVDRKSLTISTKIGLRSNEFPNGLGARNRIVGTLKSSLSRLQTNYVDILFLHAPDPSTDVLETVTTMLELKDGHFVKNFGICNARPADISAYVLAMKKLGVSLENFYIQNYFNWARRSFDYWDGLKAINDGLGWKSVSYGLLARGVFMPSTEETDNETRKKLNIKIMSEVKNSKIRSHLDQAQEVCIFYGQTIYTYSLSYGYYQSDFSIIGIRNMQQLEMLVDFQSKIMPKDVFLKIYEHLKNFNMDFEVALGDPF
jgi:aryl-alcohol dehydrogenase-like predicted oxidoreductase